MAKTKTKPIKSGVRGFITGVESETRRKDTKALLQFFEKTPGWKAKMWGPTIVGFGAYHYTYDTGHSGSSCVVGFSPRKANLVIYVFGFPGKADLLQKLGRHKGGPRDVCTSIDSPMLTPPFSRRSFERELPPQRGPGR